MGPVKSRGSGHGASPSLRKSEHTLHTLFPEFGLGGYSEAGPGTSASFSTSLDQVQVHLPPLDQPCSLELDLVMLALLLDLNDSYVDLLPPHPSTRPPTTPQW